MPCEATARFCFGIGFTRRFTNILSIVRYKPFFRSLTNHAVSSDSIISFRVKAKAVRRYLSLCWFVLLLGEEEGVAIKKVEFSLWPKRHVVSSKK